MVEEIALEIQGTAFQRMVWEEITKIPPGETSTYKNIAIAIGRPGSYRAVANACGSNPVPISIPCSHISVDEFVSLSSISTALGHEIRM